VPVRKGWLELSPALNLVGQNVAASVGISSLAKARALHGSLAGLPDPSIDGNVFPEGPLPFRL